jgi:hypothetical protein
MLVGRLPPGYTWTARTQTCSHSSRASRSTVCWVAPHELKQESEEVRRTEIGHRVPCDRLSEELQGRPLRTLAGTTLTPSVSRANLRNVRSLFIA